MASIDDVLSALNDAVSASIVSAGVTNQGIIAPGWPNMPDLTKQMEEVPAQYYVSLYPLPTERLTTRFFPKTWVLGSSQAPTLMGTLTESSVTFTGTPQAGVNVTAIVRGGSPTQSQAVTYQTTGSDTLETISAALAAKIIGLDLSGVNAGASGPTMSVTGVVAFSCNIGGVLTVGQEVLRTLRHFQVSVWAPDAPLRNAIAAAIKLGFATTYFLQFPDTSYGRLKYVSSPWSDDMQRDTLYNAKMIYSVEWAELQTQEAAQITAIEFSTQAVSGGQTQPPYPITEG